MFCYAQTLKLEATSRAQKQRNRNIVDQKMCNRALGYKVEKSAGEQNEVQPRRFEQNLVNLGFSPRRKVHTGPQREAVR